MRIIYIYILCLLFVFSCKENNQNKISIVHSDSIFIKKDLKGNIIKTTYYPSNKKDSFDLKSIYINSLLVDSGYVSKNGFIKGNKISFINDSIKGTYQYLTINKKKYLNQFWYTMGNDTLNNNGHYYRFKVFDSLFIHKKIQFELLVAKSYENEIDSVFLFLQRMGLI